MIFVIEFPKVVAESFCLQFASATSGIEWLERFQSNFLSCLILVDLRQF